MAELTWVAGFRTGVVSPFEPFRLRPSRAFADETLRQVLHLAGGGAAVRVVLTNQYGRRPLRLGGARIAVRTRGSGIDPATDRALVFPEAVVPPGETTTSDPVDLAVTAGTDLVLSLYLPRDNGPVTYSHQPAQTAYVTSGDRCAEPRFEAAGELESRYLVGGVDVLAPAGTPVSVAFGDSWFEGRGTTPNTNGRLPDLLTARLARGWFVNQGIGTNRLLTDVIGERALARFDRDVLAVPGARHVLLHFGLNDLGVPGRFGTGTPPSADDLVAGFTELARRGRAAGLTVVAATLGPYAGTTYPGYDTPRGQAIRRETNAWLRTEFGPYADFDAVADPADPGRLRPEYDSGDHIHLNDTGTRALAESIDLTPFTR